MSTSAREGQCGFSLISLMIGLVISMIGMLAMLSMYRNLVGTSVQALQSSRQDGQVAAGLLTAQRELSSAGFRIDDAAAGTHLILLSGAAFSNGSLSGTSQSTAIPTLAANAAGGASGNALVWSFKSSATATGTCLALLVDTRSGALMRLQAASGCTQASQWSSANWTSSNLVEAGQVGTFFSLRYTPCWPYSKTGDATASANNRLQVTMIANGSTEGATAGTYLTQQSTVCLPNFTKVASG